MPTETPAKARRYVGLSVVVFLATVGGMIVMPKDMRSEWSLVLMGAGLGLMKLLNTTQNAETDRKVECDVKQTETAVKQGEKLLNGEMDKKIEDGVMRVLIRTGLIPAPPKDPPQDKPKG
jgi:hypothetical protein